MHSGPLPSPETLAAYADILPDAAERIMQMAEKEQSQQHNIDNERIRLSESALNKKVNNERLGLIIAGLLGVLAMACGVTLIIVPFLLSKEGGPSDATIKCISTICGLLLTGKSINLIVTPFLQGDKKK